MVAKYDYITLRNEYIQTPGLSIRALCERHNIKTWSVVNKRKNVEDWDAKRTEFQRQVENKSLEALAEKRARKVAEIQLDALDVIHAGLLQMAADMTAVESYEDKDGNIKTRRVMYVHPREFAIFVEKFQALIGQPQAVSENRNLNANLFADVDHDDLRSLLAALRPKQPLIGPAGATQAADPPRTRSN